MVGFLLLLNQLICKFNTLFHDILDEVFPAIAGMIFNVVPTDAFPSGPGTTNTEVCGKSYSIKHFLMFVNEMNASAATALDIFSFYINSLIV